MEIFGIPSQAFFGQLLLGLINGSFYAVLSLGLAIIFGLLNIINFAHGAQYMLGAFAAWMGLNWLGINYWAALVLAPLVVGLLAVVIERSMLRHLYKLDHLYSLLLTFGLALIAEGVFKNFFGVSGESYEAPEILEGGVHLGFMYLPIYRASVVVAALIVPPPAWYVIERTSLGAIVTGLGLGIVEGLTKVFYPEASAVVIFLIMVLVLLVKPAGLFGKQA
jgi:branched-chain amino acid transport system permease protein